ncbi:AMP-binding protein [Novipirellula sp. SH528]|uniref:AMP-binding protein n=1 Tax=Novipirellula sp. SH528 TaxID=3454466 RepID=UPI003FA0836F
MNRAAEEPSVERLVDCGLSATAAGRWIPLLRELMSIPDAGTRWTEIASRLLMPEIPFAVHEWLYHWNYRSHFEDRLPCPAWQPSVDEIQATHIAAWMRDTGVASYEALHAWSLEHREEFVVKLVAALSIQFVGPIGPCCDTSAGVEAIRWFPDATLNIVESCFQADEAATAIITADATNQLQSMTYAQLKAATARVANGLAELGVQPGDRVAVCMPMTADAVSVFLGIIAAGCAVVTIADSFSAEEMAVRIKITQPKCIFIQDEILRNGKSFPLYEKITSQQTLQAVVLRASGDRGLPLRSGDLEWSDFLSADTQLKCVPRRPHDESTILFSSGTTGNPKAIPWDHTTPIKSASDAYFHHDVHSEDVLCWPTNLGWMMGPWLVYAALINKATLALSESAPTSRTFCEFVSQAKVSMLGLVPSMVSVWRQGDMTSNLDWTAIRRFSSTGECSNASDMLWLMSRAGYRPIIEYCGGTETGGGYITGTLTKPAVPSLFSAKAMGCSWLLLNEAGEESAMGEVFFEPPALGLSTRLLNRDHHEVYFADIPAGPDGQVLRRHGDQIEALPGGYFRARGRIDDAMNLGGIKVSCVQIEELLVAHESVRELAAISVPPAEGGPEKLILYAVLDAEVDLPNLVNDLQQCLKHRLNPLFKIHALEPITKLPRTASNKIMRRELRTMYLEKNHS